MKKIISLFFSMMASAAMIINATAPKDYYAPCEGKTGEALLTALNALVGPHTNVGYDKLWTVYKTSDIDENGKIWDMYSTKRWNPGSEQCGNYSSVGDCYNREHSFPKSWFDDKAPMVSDAFHIYPTDGKVNGQRSNYPFGECANGTTLSSSGGVKALGKLGKSTFSGYSGTVFEPDDAYKGDFARTYFYMAAAYKDKISSWSSDMLAGNSYPAYKTWAVNLLLKWHRQDEVSDKEINRNEVVYGYQSNRNPFIDHPELVEYIWGNKVGEAWYANGAPTPTLALPVDNSTVDFGMAATNYTVSRAIEVKGSDLTSAVTLSISGAGFKLQKTTLTASAVNAGTTISVSFNTATAGIATGVLTLSSDEVNAKVNLTAEAISGIPALPAINVTETGFTARWTSLGDAETYELIVKQGGVVLAGYPVTVNAEFEEYDVTGLNPETEYSYMLTSDTRESNEVKVTTSSLVPDVQYLNGSEFEFATEPDEASEAIEVWLDVENIANALTISVSAPFAVSTDMTNWTQRVEIAPEEDRFYLRVNGVAAGEYSTTITITDGSYVNDEGMATATVRDMSTPWFVEDFEKAGEGKYDAYSAQTFVGNPCDWKLTDAGIWSSDDSYEGDYALRFGKTASSAMESLIAKTGGIEKVSFYAERWSSSDGNMTLQVEYLPEGASSWVAAGEVVVSADTYALYEVAVNVAGNNYIRLRQTAGKRGMIDAIVVTDYRESSIDGVLDDTLTEWDSYCLNKSLVIVNHGKAANYMVYNVDGKTVGAAKLQGAQYTISLPTGLYIVTDGTNSRRVVVK